MEPGDVLTIHAAGGGGFGPPLARDPARLRADLESRYITRDAARTRYGYAGE